jgi:hypothetical protein
VKTRLSRHKWLTGGIEVVESVSQIRVFRWLDLMIPDSENAVGQDATERDAGPVSCEDEERGKGEVVKSKGLRLRCRYTPQKNSTVPSPRTW